VLEAISRFWADNAHWLMAVILAALGAAIVALMIRETRRRK